MLYYFLKKEILGLLLSFNFLLASLIFLFTNPFYSMLIFLCVFLFLLFLSIRNEGNIFGKNKTNLLVIILYALFYLFVNQYFSPIYTWDDPLISYIGKNEAHHITVPIHRINFIEAAKYDFSGFTHSYFGAQPNMLTTFKIPFIAFTTILLDLSPLDIESYYRIIHVHYTIYFIFCSFFLYLFLRNIFKKSFFIPFFGGFMLIAFNEAFHVSITSFFPMCVMYYGFFFVFLYIFSEFTKRKKQIFAFLSGLIYSLFVYFYAEHPEPVRNAILVLFLYLTLFFFFYNWDWKNKFKAVFWTMLGFSLGISYYFAAFLHDVSLKELVVVGHMEQIHMSNYLSVTQIKYGFFLILPLFITILVKGKQWLIKKPLVLITTLFYLLIFIVLILFNHYRKPLVDVFALVNAITGLNLYVGFQTRHFTYVCFAVSFFTLSSFYYIRIINFKTLIILSILLYPALFMSNPELFQDGFRNEPLHIVYIWLLIFGFFIYHKFSNKTFIRYVASIFIIVIFSIYIYSWINKRAVFKNYGNQSAQKENCNFYYPISYYLAGLKTMPYFKNHEPTRDLFEKKLNGFYKDYCKNRLNKKICLDIQKSKDENLYKLLNIYQPEIDNFYAEKSCNKKLGLNHTHRDIYWPEYNSSYLLELETKNSYVLNAIGDYIIPAGAGWGLKGQTSGFFVVNYLLDYDNNYTKNYPPINDLYLKPYMNLENFKILSYSINNNYYIGYDSIFLNAKTRKIHNIAGIDYYLFNEKRYEKLKQEEDIEILKKPNLPQSYDDALILVKDKNSYGIAYLAKKIKYTKPISHKLFDYQKDFRSPYIYEKIEKLSIPKNWIHPNYNEEIIEKKSKEFEKLVTYLLDSLSSLKGKMSIIIEDKDKAGKTIVSQKENEMKIVNIDGGRAMFQVDCLDESCTLVYNVASVYGWKAFLNYRELEINKANYSFLSVDIPRGKHYVWFEYRNLYTIISSYIVLLTLLFVLVYLSRNRIFFN